MYIFKKYIYLYLKIYINIYIYIINLYAYRHTVETTNTLTNPSDLHQYRSNCNQIISFTLAQSSLSVLLIYIISELYKPLLLL